MMTVYVVLGAAFLFLAAWLMRPQQLEATENIPFTKTPWQSYAFRLAVSAACVLIAVLLIAFLTMALLDWR